MPLQNIPVANARKVSEGVWAAGQPTPEQLGEMRAAGLRTLINLRPDRELPWDERHTAVDLGLDYVSIPIAGPADITPSAARQLHEALNREAKPALVHCASSNRVGALFALKSYFIDGQDVETALADGRAAGLKDLEPAVRTLLTEPTASA